KELPEEEFPASLIKSETRQIDGCLTLNPVLNNVLVLNVEERNWRRKETSVANGVNQPSINACSGHGLCTGVQRERKKKNLYGLVPVGSRDLSLALVSSRGCV
ncbi:hypothetical protein K0M31_006387, partial [Melipona bicolor]